VAVAGASFDFRKDRAVFSSTSAMRINAPTGVADDPAGGGHSGAAVPDPSYNYGQPWTYTRLRDIMGWPGRNSTSPGR